MVQTIETTILSDDTVATIAAAHHGGEASGTPGESLYYQTLVIGTSFPGHGKARLSKMWK